MNRPAVFGSHVALKLQFAPETLTHNSSWLVIWNVPERMSAPLPMYLAGFALLVALPSMKIVPLTRSVFVGIVRPAWGLQLLLVPFQASCFVPSADSQS